MTRVIENFDDKAVNIVMAGVMEHCYDRGNGAL